MITFRDLNLSKPLQNGLDDLQFEHPTPIQEQTFSSIMGGKDLVGIAQTGTGKTLAFMLPVLQQHKFSKKLHPSVVIIVPTRELVVQLVERINEFAKYINIRVKGVYGGTNINTQKLEIGEGVDVVVGTPGRLYDLALSRALQFKLVKKLIIDEVDVMLDLGFLFQITNIFELLPERRQNIMFSATMTDEVDALIDDFFIRPQKIAVAESGTRLENINQQCYRVSNFHTKKNLVQHFLEDRETFKKVIVFIGTKRYADLLAELLEEDLGAEMGVVHSNKSQNYRMRSVEKFDEGKIRFLITTDVMARGIDFNKVTHVVNFDTPNFPENYMHRIGRTGRAEEKGNSILLFTEKEENAKIAIEVLMNYEIPEMEFPEEVERTKQLIAEERTDDERIIYSRKDSKIVIKDAEKSEKNLKTNQGGSYRRKIELKYKKPKTRGDKNYNKKKKR